MIRDRRQPNRCVVVATVGAVTVMGSLRPHSEHGGGSLAVVFQHGQGPTIEASIRGLLELSSQATVLPVGRFLPAHEHPQFPEEDLQTVCQNSSAILL